MCLINPRITSVEDLSTPISGFHQSRVRLSNRPLTERIEGKVARTIRSPLFWTFTASAALITFTALVLTGQVALPFLLVFCPVAGAGVVTLGFVILLNKKKLYYEFTLSWVVFTSAIGWRNWYDQIVDNKLILGAIPLHNKGHQEELSHILRNGGGVLSLVTGDEARRSSMLTVPVFEEEWLNNEIKYKQIEIPDLSSGDVRQMDEALEYIHQNRITYVHCKAGVGRSACISICYLLKYRRAFIDALPGTAHPVDKAKAYVCGKRRQVNLNPSQVSGIHMYYLARCQH